MSLIVFVPHKYCKLIKISVGLPPEIVLQAVSEENKELVNGEERYFRLYNRLVWDKLMESERGNW